jgi:SAM-dependent methyltransferase
MQKEKTHQFWDDIYRKSQDTTEWILEPSSFLLDRILNCLARPNGGRILEIGCGTSRLARALCLHAATKQQTISVLATDVSSVCIQQNQERDKDVSNLSYKTLDILEGNLGEERWDLILDKGCLDTFFFRSKSRGGTSIATNLLDRVCTLLQPAGVYLILSPRSKLKIVRDHGGFEVERRVIEETALLVGTTRSKSYCYTCHKKEKVETTSANKGEDYPTIPICPACGMDYETYKATAKAHAPERAWRGHCMHCHES